MDTLDDHIYSNTIDTILKHFPIYKPDPIYRKVKLESEIQKPSDTYFYIEFIKEGCEPMRGLYSYRNFYLLGIVAAGKVFPLQEDDFGVPIDLLEGKEVVPANCGIGYSTIPMNVMYSHHDLCEAVKALSMGYQEGKMPWFLVSIARIIGMTSESARFREMRGFVEHALDPKEFVYEKPSSRLMLMFKNWSKMSKFVRSADDKAKLELGEGCVFTKDEMPSVLSLLHGKNGCKAKKDGCGVERHVRNNSPVLTFEGSSIPKLAGSGGKSIQPGEESKQFGDNGGISTPSFTSIYAGCGVERHVRNNSPVLTFEESSIPKLAGGNHSRMLGCGITRRWGGKHSVFGFEESGVRGHGVLGLGMMTKWGGKHRPVSIPEQSGVTKLETSEGTSEGCGMMRQLGCRMMRWQECPFTTLAAQNRFLLSAPRLLKMFVRR